MKVNTFPRINKRSQQHIEQLIRNKEHLIWKHDVKEQLILEHDLVLQSAVPG